MTKVGVVLSGCGVFDGAEIHESALTLFFLDKAGSQIICMAPDVDQMHVINHIKGEAASDKRNVLLESSRIARGISKTSKISKVLISMRWFSPAASGPQKTCATLP